MLTKPDRLSASHLTSIRRHLRICIVAALVAAYLVLTPFRASANASIELYGTFNAMGITISLADTDDPDRDARATVVYRAAGEPYRSGFPLSRVGPAKFVGSLFWLKPGTTYDVRVTFVDPDGDPIGGVSLYSTATTRPELIVPIPKQTHFVDPIGSGKDCTSSSPCSLSEGISQAQPGSVVVLRGGIYHQGDIYLPRSGTPNEPIIIRGHAGETAILDGADPTNAAWTAIGDGIFRTTTSVENTNLVMAGSTRLYPYPSLADLRALNWGMPGFFANGTDVYVHLDGNANPNEMAMRVSQHSIGFGSLNDHIYFMNLTFRHYGAVPSSRAISLKDASNNLIQGCTFANNMMGVTLKGESHRNVVQANTFYDAKFSWPWHAVKEASRLEQGGLDFSSGTPGRGTVIRRNTFHDYFDGFNVCPREPNVKTNETDIYENRIYNAGDDGIQADGWCSNVRFWNNTIFDVLNGISLAPAMGGPVYAIRNTMYRLGAGNNAFSGRPFKFNSNSSDGLGPIYLFHNTVDAVRPDTFGLSISGAKAESTSLIYSRNNIWAGGTYSLRNKQPGFAVDLDYDNLHNIAGDDLVLWDGVRFATLQPFAAATGQERNGLSVNPGFCNPPHGSYDLDPSSKLIDAGLFIPGINDDHMGLEPDIGASESMGQDSACDVQRQDRLFLPAIAAR